jgi:hypothetical protein
MPVLQPPHKGRLVIARYDNAILLEHNERTESGPFGRRWQCRVKRVGRGLGEIIGEEFQPEKPASPDHEYAKSTQENLNNPMSDHVCFSRKSIIFYVSWLRYRSS